MSPKKPKLLSRVRAAIRVRHMGLRTEQQYLAWSRRCVRYHDLRHPAELRDAEIVAFLTHLAVERRVARSTQMQALSALLFLYREVLNRPVRRPADVLDRG